MGVKLLLVTFLLTSAAHAQETPQVAELVPTVEQESGVDKGGFEVSLLGGFSRQYYSLTANTNLPLQIYGMQLVDQPGTLVGGEFAYSAPRSANSYRFHYHKMTSEYNEIPKAASRGTQRFDESYRFYFETKRWGLEKNWGWLFGVRRDIRSYTMTTARVSSQTIIPLTSMTETGISLGVKNKGKAFFGLNREFAFETFLPIFVSESPASGSQQYILVVEMMNSLVYPFADSFEASLGLGLSYDRSVFGGSTDTRERNLRDVTEETIGVFIPVKVTYKF
jgi:hypothetical protein